MRRGWALLGLLALAACSGVDDVAVVNTSLLNRRWYAALMTERHDITGGYSVDSLEKLSPEDIALRVPLSRLAAYSFAPAMLAA